MKALTVNMEHIVQSMRDLVRETDDFYLDLNTGQVLALSRKLLKFISSEIRGEEDVIQGWDAPLIPVAREIAISGSSDYLRIPEAFGRPERHWMAEFTVTIRGVKLRQKLSQMLRGRGCCDRFKDELKGNAEEFNRWLTFRQKKWEDRVQKWLEQHAIIAVSRKVPTRRAAA